MEMSNTPVEGTGASSDQDTALTFEQLLASENATSDEVVETNETESEQEEVSNTAEDDDVEDAEQSGEDSEEVDTENTEEVQGEAEKPETDGLSEDTLIDVQGEQMTLKELREEFEHNLQIMAASIAHTFQMTEMPDEELRQIDFPAWQDQMTRYAKEQRAVKEIWDAGEVIKANNAKFAAEKLHLAQVEMIKGFGERYPEFKDKDKVHPLMNELGTFLSDQGFHDEEIGNMHDERMLDIVYRLYKHEVIAKKVPEVVKAIAKKPPISGSGTATVKTKPKSSVDAAIAQHNRAPSSRSNKAIFQALLDSD